MMLARLLWTWGLRDTSALLMLMMLAGLVLIGGLRDSSALLMLMMLAWLVLIGRPAWQLSPADARDDGSACVDWRPA